MIMAVDLIEILNEALGVDTYNKSRVTKYSRARQGVWFTLKKNGLSFKEIAELYGCSRQAVEKGVYQFEYKAISGEECARVYMDILNKYW